MNLLGYVKFFRGRVQIECTEVRPQFHYAKSVEQRHFMLQCNPTHVVAISSKRNHRFRPRAVLRVDQNNISACRMGNVDTLIQALTELIWIDRQHRVDGAGLPDQQRRLGRLKSTGSALTISAAVRFAFTSVVTFTSTPGKCS